MNLLLIPLLAMLNRFRGANGFTFIGKIGVVITLLILLFPNTWSIVVVSILYIIGQSCGWGWWIGSIIDRKPKIKPVEGIREEIAHWTANKLTDDYLWYSRIALAIIGFFWWFPVFLAIYIFNDIKLYQLMFPTFICSLGFPTAFDLAIIIYKPIKFDLVNDNWELGEVIYGAFQGLSLYIILG